MKQRGVICLLALLMLVTQGCATYRETGGAVGGAYGGIAGAILDHRNPWRGGIIGAALGAIAGATIADVSAQGARQAVSAGKPVEYITEDRRATYYAEPEGYDDARQCRRVREKVYVDGRLVKRRTVLYCDRQDVPPPPRYRYERRHERYERDDDD